MLSWDVLEIPRRAKGDSKIKIFRINLKRLCAILEGSSSRIIIRPMAVSR
jgi:hypothetical protein